MISRSNAVSFALGAAARGRAGGAAEVVEERGRGVERGARAGELGELGGLGNTTLQPCLFTY
mgnify:CR=1 FL=1